VRKEPSGAGACCARRLSWHRAVALRRARTVAPAGRHIAGARPSRATGGRGRHGRPQSSRGAGLRGRPRRRRRRPGHRRRFAASRRRPPAHRPAHTASPSRPRSTHPTVTVCSPTSTSRVSGTATGVGRTPGPATEARAGRDSLTDALPGLVALACTALLVNAIFDLVVVLAPPMPSWFVSRSAGHRHAWRCDSWLVIARFHTRGT
jgi:hypothetical protein